MEARTGIFNRGDGIPVALLRKVTEQAGEFRILKDWSRRYGITTIGHRAGDRIVTSLDNYTPDQ